MAINLQLAYAETNFSNKTITVKDITGIDASDGSNGGYGLGAAATNPSKLIADAEIDGWDMLTTRPDASTFVTTINSLQFDNLNTVIYFDLTDTLDLANGLWTFKMDVNESGGELDTVTITQYIYNLDAVELAINTKYAQEVDFCKSLDCACNKDLAALFTYYRALLAAVEEQNTVQADYLSTQIITLIG